MQARTDSMNEMELVRPLVQKFGSQAVWDASINVLGWPIVMAISENEQIDENCVRRVEMFLTIGL